jgi:hypothetical protein
MQEPELTVNETAEIENLMDAWNYLHQKMWEQVELEKMTAERFKKEFTLDHPEKIFGSNALKTPWDNEVVPVVEAYFPEELQVATMEVSEFIAALDLSQVIDSVIPELPQGWDIVDTSIPEDEQTPVEPVAEVKPKAKSKHKSKKKKD